MIWKQISLFDVGKSHLLYFFIKLGTQVISFIQNWKWGPRRTNYCELRGYGVLNKCRFSMFLFKKWIRFLQWPAVILSWKSQGTNWCGVCLIYLLGTLHGKSKSSLTFTPFILKLHVLAWNYSGFLPTTGERWAPKLVFCSHRGQSDAFPSFLLGL